MSSPEKPVAVYLRVSTDDQSHDSQRAEVLKHLESKGVDPGRVEWYADVDSGRKLSRKDYDRLKRDVAAGKRKTVVVYSLDRLARDMIEGMELVGTWCRAGVGLSSVTQPIDVSGGPIGLAIAAFLFAFAEIEWKVRKDRQRAGIDVAKSNGVYTGRKAGTRKADAARAAELRARGLYLPEIAAALGVHERTVARYLRLTSGASASPIPTP